MIYEIVNKTGFDRTTEAITTDIDLARKFMQKYEDAWDEDFPLDLVITEYDEDTLEELLDGDIKLYSCVKDKVTGEVECEEISIINWSDYTMEAEEVEEYLNGDYRVTVLAKNKAKAVAMARELFHEHMVAEEMDIEDALEDVEPPREGQIVINSQGTVIMNKATYLNLLEKNL